MSLSEGFMSMLSNSLPSMTAAPVLEPTRPAAAAPTATPAPAPTGCGMKGVATVLVFGDLHGDGDRLRAAVRHSAACVEAAKRSANAVHFAFLGNIVPCHHSSEVDAVDLVLRYVAGTANPDVRKEHVHVVLGPKDVGLLRFVRRGCDGELALFGCGDTPSASDVDAMRAALQRPPPLRGAAEWAAYESALAKHFDVSGLVLPATAADGAADDAARRQVVDALHVLMLVKLEAMAAVTYDGAYLSREAPGLVRACVCANKERRPGWLEASAAYLSPDADATDALAALRCPRGDAWWIRDAVARLFDSTDPTLELSDDGRAVARIARPVLEMFFSYLDSHVLPLLRAGKLIDAVGAHEDADAAVATASVAGATVAGADGGDDGDAQRVVWLVHSGTSDGALGTIVGRLPRRVAVAVDGAPRVEWAPYAAGAPQTSSSARAWATRLNRAWRGFVSGFPTRADDLALWTALSMRTSECGPLVSASATPLRGLVPPGSLLPATGAVASPMLPFGTHQRSRLATIGACDASNSRAIKRRTTGIWCTLATDVYAPNVYWALFSFCPSTVRATMPDVDECYRSATTDTEKALSEMQRQVNQTIVGLLLKEIDGARVWGVDSGLSAMRAVIGPVVERAGHNNDRLRATFWYAPLGDGPPPALVLFPDLWIRNVLAEYAQKSPPRHTSACPSMIEGVLVLRNDERLDPWFPADATGYTPAELEGLRAELGARAWQLPTGGLRSAERVRLARKVYAAELGGRVLETFAEEPYDVFHTKMSAEDCFAGLVVKLAPSYDADEKLPLLTICGDHDCATLEEFLNE